MNQPQFMNRRVFPSLKVPIFGRSTQATRPQLPRRRAGRGGLRRPGASAGAPGAEPGALGAGQGGGGRFLPDEAHARGAMGFEDFGHYGHFGFGPFECKQRGWGMFRGKSLGEIEGGRMCRGQD